MKRDKHQLKDLNKKIKKCKRDTKRTKRQEKIQRILEEFRGIKSRSCIKSGRKRTLIPKVKNDKGETIKSHQEKELQMSLVNFAARNMPKISLEKKYKTLKTWKQELALRRKAVTKR